MSDLKIYLVCAANTLEDSSWHVVAEDHDAAAEAYVKAALEEHISVDIEDIAEGGFLIVNRISDMSRGPGIIDWEDTAEINIMLESVPAWRDRPGEGARMDLGG